MSTETLQPADREAVTQIRALLKTDHTLSAAEEEALIASFLEHRNTQQSEGAMTRWQQPALRDLALRPGVAQAGAVALNAAAVVTLWQTAVASCPACGLYNDVGGTGFGFDGIVMTPQATMAVIALGIVLLPVLLLGILAAAGGLRRQLSSQMRTAVATFMLTGIGVGLVETLALSWWMGAAHPTRELLIANIVALGISLLIATGSAILARIPPATVVHLVYDQRRDAAQLPAGTRE